VDNKQEQALTAVSIGIKRFYRLIKVLKDLKVINIYRGYNLSHVHKYSERVLNIIEDKK
jgi:hypothetical protein